MSFQWGGLIAAGFLLSAALLAADRATVRGQVIDESGKPVARAMVIVYSAGVKTGYSTFCPTCYPDCGKRALTDNEGRYRIDGLNTELLFRLLAVREGFQPLFIQKVDAVQGTAPAATLKPRRAVTDPARMVRGRVTDDHGRPIRDVVVEPHGVAVRTEAGQLLQIFGSPDGLERVAVSNEKGEFELAHAVAAESMVLLLQGRGIAPKKLLAVPTGLERRMIVLEDGAVVRGRLLQNGKPVVGAEMGLYSMNHFNGHGYEEIRVGTAEDGRFAFTNVPAGEDWYAYGKMESLARRGAIAPVKVTTRKNLEEIDLGDIVVGPGYRVRGTVKLSDDKPVPQGMRLSITPGCGACTEEQSFEMAPGKKVIDRSYQLRDNQTVLLGPDGHFEFAGLAKGPYQVNVAVKGYQLDGEYAMIRPAGPGAPSDDAWQKMSEMNRRMLQMSGTIEVPVEGDVEGLTIRLAPGALGRQ